MNNKITETNNLMAKFPDIAKQWHPTKNGNLKPSDFLPGSEHRAYWLCDKGHDWAAKIRFRTKGSSCPYCSGRKVLAGFNDLATTHPDVARWWHPTKNGDLKPTDITFGSKKKVYWRCENGHDSYAEIKKRVKGAKCLYCANKKVFKGFNDLRTTDPELAKQWHPTMNGDLKPTDIMAGRAAYAWWYCDTCRGSYRMRIDHRKNGEGCPYCAGKRVLRGFNDLASQFPDIALEWDYSKNGNIGPEDVTYGTNQKFHWKCRHNHTWETRVNTRTSGHGCPHCSASGTSMPEMILLYYLRKYGKTEIIHRYRKLGFELDLYFETNGCKIGIEYDGFLYHKDKDRQNMDLNKNKICEENNIKLYRIRENPLTSLNSTSVDFIYNYNKRNELEEIISQLIQIFFNELVKVNIDSDISEINLLTDTSKKKNSIAITHPNVAKQWHSTKNGSLTPYDKTYGSNTKVWWECECGCSWLASIISRTEGYNNCPNCKKNKKEKVALKVSPKIQITKDNKIKVV